MVPEKGGIDAGVIHAAEPASTTQDGPVLTSIASVLRTLAVPKSMHPIFVHYTIALSSSSLLFELLGRLLDRAELMTTAWWALALSVVATVATLITGVTARRRLDIGEGTARSYLRLHMALGPAYFGMLLGTVVWRARLWSTQEPPGWWYLAALAASCAVMAAQGYAGGELVYRWGAEVEGRARGLKQRRAAEPAPTLGGTVSARVDR